MQQHARHVVSHLFEWLVVLVVQPHLRHAPWLHQVILAVLVLVAVCLGDRAGGIRVRLELGAGENNLCVSGQANLFVTLSWR